MEWYKKKFEGPSIVYLTQIQYDKLSKILLDNLDELQLLKPEIIDYKYDKDLIIAEFIGMNLNLDPPQSKSYFINITNMDSVPKVVKKFIKDEFGL